MHVTTKWACLVDFLTMSAAAKTVSFSPLRRAQISVKNTLDTPFKLNWPGVSTDVAEQMLMELERSLSDLKGCFARSKVSKSKRKQGHCEVEPSHTDKEQQGPPRKKQCTGHSTDKETEKGINKTDTEPHSTGQDTNSEPAGEEPEGTSQLAKKSQLIVGVNNVTRCLERGELSAGLVCLSARPALVTRHIMMLAATRCVPFAALPNLSQRVVQLLGDIKSALAIGFKKTNVCEFSGLIGVISTLAPPIVLPWLSPSEEPKPTQLIKGPAKTIPSAPTQLSSSHKCEDEESVKSVTADKKATAAAEDESCSKKLDNGEESQLHAIKKATTKFNVRAGTPYTPVQIKRTIVRAKKQKRQTK